MSSQYLTLHMLNALPWHNMNRDANGRPKRLKQGGVERAMLSSQSLKRAARVAYEDEIIADKSFRSSRYGVDEVLARASALAAEHGLEVDLAKLRKTIEPVILHLVAAKPPKEVKAAKGSPAGDEDAPAATDDEGSAATNVWLSGDEIDTIARAALDTDLSTWIKTDKGAIKVTAEHPLGVDHQVGSLAIAAFGRMFANASDRQTEAAIAVSPATTTHRVIIETDYFTVVDDLQDTYNPEGGAGASYIDTANFTTGVYYRSVTIDREQLKRSWSGASSQDADDRLRALLRSIIYALPTGKKNSAPAQTKPLTVLLEEQSYRAAYEFDTPVQPDQETGGGYKAPSVARLATERRAAVRFDPAVFGQAMVAGTCDDLDQFEVDVVTVENIVEHVIGWLKA
jgi:CRISPR system Cascade subunit CasC